MSDNIATPPPTGSSPSGESVITQSEGKAQLDSILFPTTTTKAKEVVTDTLATTPAIVPSAEPTAEPEVSVEPVDTEVVADGDVVAEPTDEPVKEEEVVVAESKIKLDLGDGEKEYTHKELQETVSRIKNKEILASKKFNEAFKLSQTNKQEIAQAKQILQLINEQPYDLVKHIVSTRPTEEMAKVKDTILDIANSILEEEALSPDQKRIKELEREKSAQDVVKQREEESKKAQDDKTQSEANEALIKANMHKYATAIADSVKEAGLPEDNTIYSMVNYQCGLQRQEGNPIDVKMAITKVVSQMEMMAKIALKSRNPDLIARFADEDVLNSIRGYDKSRAKPKSTRTSTADADKILKANPKPKERTKEDKLADIFFRTKK